MMMLSAGRLEIVNSLTDTLRGKCSILDDTRSTTADDGIILSPEKVKKKSIRSPVNEHSRNSIEKESGSNIGFFLTGAVESYDEDAFEVEGAPESRNDNSPRSSGNIIITESESSC